VKHDILLGKLEHYGINDKAGDLIKSYLNDRYQREIIKHEYYKSSSVRDKVRQGVPQGLILGPLFFLLYIKDLPYIINNISKSTLFADDTSTKFSTSDSTDHGPEFIMTFDKINLQFAINSLSLNLNKTNFVHFTAKSNTKLDINIYFEYIQFHNIYNIKFFGLTIGNTLSWKIQIEQLASKLSSAGYSIRSLKSIMFQKSLRKNYYSYVHSIKLYGTIFWGNLPYSNSIFKIKKE